MVNPVVVWIAFVGVTISRFKIGHFGFDTVWGEDGEFLSDALRSGWGSLDDGQAGYLHVVPRILAIGVAGLPVNLVPLGFLILTSMIVGFVALLATRVMTPIMPLNWSKYFFGLAIVALPISGAEALGNAANIQQWLWVGGLMACIGTTSTRWEKIGGDTLLVGAGLSSPLSVLLLPIVVWRRRHDRATTLLFLIAFSLQALHALLFGDQRGNPPVGSKSPFVQAKTFLFWVPNGITAKDQSEWTATGLTFIVVCLILLWVCRHAMTREIWLLLLLAVVYWFISTGFGQGATYRHAVVPGLLVVAAITGIAQSSRLLTPFAVTLSVLWLIQLGVWGPRVSGPSWKDAVRAVTVCDATTPLPIAPGAWGVVKWPCDRL